MIAKIERTTLYGKEQFSGINVIPDLEEPSGVFYAHSIQDAARWAKEYPLYQDAHIEEYPNGNMVFTSQWMPRNKDFDNLYVEDLNIKNADYECTRLTVVGVNTIYEQTGFRPPERD